MNTTNEENNCKTSAETIKSYLDRKFQKKESISIYKHLDNVIAVPFFNEDKTHRYGLIIEKDKKSDFSQNIFNFNVTIKDLNKNEAEVKKTLCVIMLNPSYADEYIADKSTYRLEKNIFLEGDFDQNTTEETVNRIIIVNKFSEFCTSNFNPTEDTGESELNLKYLERAIALSRIVILAWGASVDKVDKNIYPLIHKYKGKQYYKSKYHPSIRNLSFLDITTADIRKLLLRE